MKVELKFGIKIHSMQCMYLQYIKGDSLVPVLNKE
jgi:hypothetical protein